MFAAACLTVSGIALVGCESTNAPPPSERGATAGGNGEFGESPVNPGTYSNDRNADVSTSPTTQPSR